MAHSFSTNNTPANGSVSMYLFLATLVAAGWTKTKDSDGTTFSAAGTQVTSGSAGTNGLGNTNAWFVLRAPAVNGQQRSFCFQRSSNNTAWRIKYSYAAGFVGGSPSAAQVPSAADEVTICGSGTDAAPGFATALPGDGTYRFNACGGDTTIGYGFYWHTFKIADTSSFQMALILDVLVTSSASSADVDPAIVYHETTNTSIMFTGLKVPYNGGSQGRCYYGVGGVPTWTAVISAVYVDNWQQNYCVAGLSEVSAAGSNGTNGWNGKDDVVPIAFGRPKDTNSYGPACNSFGWKCFGQLMKYVTVLRANMDTLSVDAGTKNYIWFNGTAIPWDGSTPVI